MSEGPSARRGRGANRTPGGDREFARGLKNLLGQAHPHLSAVAFELRLVRYPSQSLHARLRRITSLRKSHMTSFEIAKPRNEGRIKCRRKALIQAGRLSQETHANVRTPLSVPNEEPLSNPSFRLRAPYEMALPH